MLEQLREIVDEEYFLEEGFAEIVGMTKNQSELVVRLRICIPGNFDRQIEVACRRTRSHRIVAELADDVELTSDHPVLWPYNRSHGALYFNGIAPSVNALFGELVTAQSALTGTWFSMDRFLNMHRRVIELLEGGYGLLANGPVELLKEFQGVLSKHGVRGSLLESRVPMVWNGSEWTAQTEPLYALIVGESWVVAPEFDEKLL